MEIQGKVIQILPLQSGEGKNGSWKKQDFILEIPGNYPKKVCVSLWGNRIDEATLSEGVSIKVHIDIESREFNGRWYTDVKAWKIETEGDVQDAPPPSESDFIPPQEDDLPF